MKDCNEINTISKTKGLLNLIGYWNLEHKDKHKQEDWTNLETIKKNQKLRSNLQRQCHPQIDMLIMQNLSFYIA